MDNAKVLESSPSLNCQLEVRRTISYMLIQQRIARTTSNFLKGTQLSQKTLHWARHKGDQ
eukprot:Gb_38290 [translate_table: standard]